MSDNFEKLYRFFSDLGFSVNRIERFESFGNYIIEGCSSHFCIRGIRDRSVESIELKSLDERETWFDMGLVMACVGMETMLDQEANLDIEMKFVETHIDQLAILFDEENYPNTKAKLEELGLQRAKHAFPRWFT